MLELRVGDRVQLTPEAIARGVGCRCKHHRGVIVSVGQYYYVRRDGFKTPTAYAKEFWVREPGAHG